MDVLDVLHTHVVEMSDQSECGRRAHRTASSIVQVGGACEEAISAVLRLLRWVGGGGGVQVAHPEHALQTDTPSEEVRARRGDLIRVARTVTGGVHVCGGTGCWGGHRAVTSIECITWPCKTVEL
jgi:hypothetical protein